MKADGWTKVGFGPLGRDPPEHRCTYTFPRAGLLQVGEPGPPGALGVLRRSVTHPFTLSSTQWGR